ncbi:MAG TPA: type II toxin-antitoxin system RelE/ParE family toxin [Erysipelothrix sp.]|nr:type II toxin-antitoxin system RelE/ParE family toxin [Erysipelothrix sp.]
MTFNLNYDSEALKVLRKMDPYQRKLILKWIHNNLNNCTDPRSMGKPLKASLNDFWRYRVGQYRIIVEIKDAELMIIIVNVGNRRDVCK